VDKYSRKRQRDRQQHPRAQPPAGGWAWPRRDAGPCRRVSEEVQLRWWHAGRALVGRGLLGCGSGPDGRRVDGGRYLAAAIRSGGRYGQCAGRAGRGRPVGDDADVRGGRRLLRPNRARAAAGRDRRAADPDHRGRRGHA